MSARRTSRRKRGQSLTDYVLVIGVVTACMASMHTFLRRYVQSQIRVKTDDLLAVCDPSEDSTSVIDVREPCVMDAKDPNPQTRGMRTQRMGTGSRKPGSGFVSDFLNNGPTLYLNNPVELQLGGNYPSASTTWTNTNNTSIVDEPALLGGRRVTRPVQVTIHDGKEAYAGYRVRPPQLLVRPGRWFSRDGERRLKYGAEGLNE